MWLNTNISLSLNNNISQKLNREILIVVDGIRDICPSRIILKEVLYIDAGCREWLSKARPVRFVRCGRNRVVCIAAFHKTDCSQADVLFLAMHFDISGVSDIVAEELDPFLDVFYNGICFGWTRANVDGSLSQAHISSSRNNEKQQERRTEPHIVAVLRREKRENNII